MNMLRISVEIGLMLVLGHVLGGLLARFDEWRERRLGKTEDM